MAASGWFMRDRATPDISKAPWWSGMEFKTCLACSARSLADWVSFSGVTLKVIRSSPLC